ncbi:SRPBCC family protein [Pseudonocardia kunmingensis]|uniref:Polyketide cyclase/dehydrase/lipid transport protein n=1 Tax=Pseudonocardia kunmingensis TaxID=630975 RepID=A0A543DX38_9PSEU|nr:SRPBCC family protein [Pseudonocardia kunmingensis]TQM13881.1 polyketide cyclase/dehydrase/lipid transport protein [Pseudonocardia kunmingensis]
MQTLDRDELSVHVPAPPDVVYRLVSDVTRMPEFSPEILRCVWLDGADGPAVGARFRATNKLPRRPPWRNTPVVLVADPGREFTISRTEPFAGTLVWRYRLEPEGDGTRVTESYEVTRPITRLGWFIIGTLFGGRDRRTDLRHGMHQTLQRVAAAAERETAAG